MNLGNLFIASGQTDQSGIAQAATKLTPFVVSYDADGQFATDTLTVTSPGIWMLGGTFTFTGVGLDDRVEVYIGSGNGASSYFRVDGWAAAAGIVSVSISGIRAVAANDTLAVFALVSAGNMTFSAATTQNAPFWGFKLA